MRYYSGLTRFIACSLGASCSQTPEWTAIWLTAQAWKSATVQQSPQKLPVKQKNELFQMYYDAIVCLTRLSLQMGEGASNLALCRAPQYFWSAG